MDVTAFALRQFIPHPMMLFGASTYDEDGAPHMALASWVNFYWDDGLGIVLCLDGDKAVKRNLGRAGCMVLNTFTKDEYPSVDRLGRAVGSEKAAALEQFSFTEASSVKAPALSGSPLSYEVKLRQVLEFKGSDLYLCSIEHVASNAPDELLSNAKGSYDILGAQPMMVSQASYLTVCPESALGAWD